MDKMTYQDIIKDIIAKNYKPVYLLHGEESYFIDEISNYIEKKVLNETERSFNQTILYGKEATYMNVVDSARRFPVMAERQVVIIKEAKEMKDLNALEKYLNHPSPTTILVICHKHKKIAKNTKLAKAAIKNGVFFESQKLYDNQVPDWITAYLHKKKYKIKEDATQMVAEFLGTNLSKVSNELDKLMLNVSMDTIITTDIVQKNIGISKDYNIFELNNAVGRMDKVKAQRIVNYFIADIKKHPLPQVVSSLFGFFSKLYVYQSLGQINEAELAQKMGMRSSFFLKDYRAAAKNYSRQKVETAISILSEYDLKSKGVNRDGVSETELLRELVFKLMN
jgi:DNA polymerase III subunit delta